MFRTYRFPVIPVIWKNLVDLMDLVNLMNLEILVTWVNLVGLVDLTDLVHMGQSKKQILSEQQDFSRKTILDKATLLNSRVSGL